MNNYDGVNIRTDTFTFNSNDLSETEDRMGVERMEDGSVIIRLADGGEHRLTGQSAQQAWVQIREWSNDLVTFRAKLITKPKGPNRRKGK